MESMTSCTALAVAGETRRVPFRTCDTVDTETPAFRATSVMVATAPPGLGFKVAFLAIFALLVLYGGKTIAQPFR
jgi:hypothetical protein